MPQEPIAIVGIGCRLPGADNPESFWQLLKNGVDAVSEVPESRWEIEAYYDSDPTAPGKTYSRWGGFLDQIDHFDPQFFGIQPREGSLYGPPAATIARGHLGSNGGWGCCPQNSLRV